MNAAFENKFFLPYQRAWIQDQASLRIVEKGRQIGMTTADAYDSVKKALARGGSLDVWVSSRDLPTARAYLRICKRWAQTFQVAADGPEWEMLDYAKDLGAFTLRFKSGRCIFSLSSKPDALVGKTGHIKLDEFAVHREQAELYRVAKPCTTWGGQLSIISTHRGDQTVFYEILDAIKHKGNPMGWSHHRVTLQDAVAQGLVEKINKVRGLKNPPATLLLTPGFNQMVERVSVEPLSGHAPLNPSCPSLRPGFSRVPGDDHVSASSNGPLTPGLNVPGDAHSSASDSPSLTPGFSQVSTDPHARQTVSTVCGSAARAASGFGSREGSAARAASGFGETREHFISRLRSECLDEEQWLQEYCCIPADDNAAFITHQMITQCESPGCLWSSFYLVGRDSVEPSEHGVPPSGGPDSSPSPLRGEGRGELSSAPHSSTNPSIPSSSPTGLLYVGVDIARKDHLCVIDVGEKIGDVVWDRLRIELRNAPCDEIEAELDQVMELPQIRRVCIDATGLGMHLAERAKKKYTWRIEPVNFTAELKEQLAYGLRMALEQQRVRLDPDPKLRADLRSIRKEVTAGGNFRFAGETRESHCDRFWAKALRQHAASHVPKLGAAVV